jgi:hypothetical protein
MINHAKRFSMPPPGFTATGGGRRADAAAAAAPAPMSAPTTLAQIYALAHQRAAAAVEDRKWHLLLDKLMQ